MIIFSFTLNILAFAMLFSPAGDNRYVYIFSIIALLVLVIASANYVNLATARAADRAKEVGVRKATGASRRQLFTQFMSESYVAVLIVLLIGFFIAAAALPLFNQVTGKQLSLNTLLMPPALVAVAILWIVLGFVCSIYPAVVLSAFNPIRVLKGNMKAGSSGIGLRKSLIVVQFFISTGLIMSTLVVYKQLSYIQHKKLGYDKDHVLILRNDKTLQAHLTALKAEFASVPGVQNVTTCSQAPVFVPGKYNLTLHNTEMLITGTRVDKDFIKTMKIDIASGVDFTTADEEAAFTGADSLQRPAILNETAVQSFGWTPEQAVGQVISFQGRKTVIKGVVRDFHFSSIHEPIAPFIIFLDNSTNKILVRLSGTSLEQTLNQLKSKWAGLAPHLPFDYEFMDEQFANLYTAETRTGRLCYIFSFLAVALACLGLFGLASFSAEQRAKEIGIRKVLGASSLNIAGLLSKNFLKLVFLASIISLPAAWWVLNNWLEDFAYRITIQWWMFLAAALLSVIISLLTISFQAFAAANANPVQSLRRDN